MTALVERVRLARALGGAKAFSAVPAEESEPGETTRSRAEVATFIRRAADTIHHSTGTCRRGRDAMSVVDAALKVPGIDGLRAADASIIRAW